MGNVSSTANAVQQALRGNSVSGNILVVGLHNAGISTLLARFASICRGEVIDCTNYHSYEAFRIERIYCEGIYSRFSIFGGPTDIDLKVRPLWRHYYHNIDALVWVVDSVACRDEEHMRKSADELHRLLCEEELHDCPLLFVMNKQDNPDALTLPEISGGHHLCGTLFWTCRAKLMFALGAHSMAGKHSPLRRLAGNSHLNMHIWSFVGPLVRIDPTTRSSALKNRTYSPLGCCATSGDGVHEVWDYLVRCASD